VPVFRLHDDDADFPAPYLAQADGLLAIGGDLSPLRLFTAYRNGIFPWFEEQGELFWFSPDPRAVLLPDELKVHKSMRSLLNKGRFRITCDEAFHRVMQACAHTPRQGQEGTWISPAFFEGYMRFHLLGLAHSVEVWEGDNLVGGLYGIALGKIFYGESMFSHQDNASKAGFITLVRALKEKGFQLIDCQQETPHLLSLGARNISRVDFMEHLARNVYEPDLRGKWSLDENGQLHCAAYHQ